MSSYEELNQMADAMAELAQKLRYAASGDAGAANVVRNHIDAYWHGIVIGARRIEGLLDECTGENDNGEALVDVTGLPRRRVL